MQGDPQYDSWDLKQIESLMRNYQEERGATLDTKLVTLASLWGGLALAAYLVTLPLWGYAILAAIGLGVTAHLLSLRTLRA